MKLQRNNQRSRSAQLSEKSKQSIEQTNSQLNSEMGQTNSTPSLPGSQNSQISSKYRKDRGLVNQIGQNLLAANYQDDELLQKIIKIVKNPIKAKIKNLDSPWRERFQALSLDENDFLHLDDSLSIPKFLQTPIKNSLHWEHPGRD